MTTLLFAVEYEPDDDDDMSSYVVASAHQEAFELWRISWDITPEKYAKYRSNGYGEVRVRQIDPASGASRVLAWMSVGEVQDFTIDFESMTTLAVRAAHAHAQAHSAVPAS